MKRELRSFRVHPDSQRGIEALSKDYGLQLGEVIELVVEREARDRWGRGWREVVRERDIRNPKIAESRLQPHEAPASEIDWTFGRVVSG